MESIQQLAVEQKRQDVADYQAFKEGQGQVLVLAEAKTLSHPFVEGLVPGNSPGNRANGFVFLATPTVWLHPASGAQPISFCNVEGLDAEDIQDCF